MPGFGRDNEITRNEITAARVEAIAAGLRTSLSLTMNVEAVPAGTPGLAR